MKGIEKEFESVIAAFIAAGEKIAVSVSGGKDSMCLLSLVLGSGKIDKKNVSVISVNHNLRGANGRNDVEFVGGFCARNGVEFIPYDIDVPRLAASKRLSVETAAREARLDIYRGLKTDGTAGKVLLAHHQRDNAESVLMHILRGAGLNGLRGMTVLTDGFILRPLLAVSKEEIDGYAVKNNVPFVTDETNSLNAYTRNFIRNEVMELIKTRYPNFEKALINLSLDAASTFNAYKILSDAGVKNFNRETAAAVERLKNSKSGARLDLPDGYFALNEGGGILIQKKAAVTATESGKENKPEPARSFKKGETEFGGGVIAVTKTAKPSFGGAELYFDADKIPSSAVFRRRRAGDRFKPYGSGGTKKLKEYLIDKKIPLKRRDGLILIADGDEVLVISGIEISDKVKLENKEYGYSVEFKEGD